MTDLAKFHQTFERISSREGYHESSGFDENDEFREISPKLDI